MHQVLLGRSNLFSFKKISTVLILLAFLATFLYGLVGVVRADGVQISGVITDTDGDGVEFATVEIYEDNGPLVTSTITTGKNRNAYSISGLTPGVYDVKVIPNHEDRYVYAPLTTEDINLLANTTRNFVLQPGPTPPMINVQGKITVGDQPLLAPDGTRSVLIAELSGRIGNYNFSTNYVPLDENGNFIVAVPSETNSADLRLNINCDFALYNEVCANYPFVANNEMYTETNITFTEGVTRTFDIPATAQVDISVFDVYENPVNPVDTKIVFQYVGDTSGLFRFNTNGVTFRYPSLNSIFDRELGDSFNFIVGTKVNFEASDRNQFFDSGSLQTAPLGSGVTPFDIHYRAFVGNSLIVKATQNNQSNRLPGTQIDVYNSATNQLVSSAVTDGVGKAYFYTEFDEVGDNDVFYVVATPPGVQYGPAQTSSSVQFAELPKTSDEFVNFNFNLALPNPPGNVSALSPTNQNPELTWTPSQGATKYNVFKDGNLIGETTELTYTDTSVNTDGTYQYYVTTVNQYDLESGLSGTVTVVYDAGAPQVVGVPSTTPNAAGWYKSDVTIDWQATDLGSGSPSDPADTIASTNGKDITYTSGQSCDLAGNCATGSLQLSIDKTNPTAAFTGNTAIIRLLGRTISGTAGDGLSGVARVTLATGTTSLSSDPSGGIALSCNSTKTSCTWSVSPSSSLPLGVNTYTLEVTDIAGNNFTVTRQYTVI